MPVTKSVQDVDKGYTRAMKAIKTASGWVTAVGFPGNSEVPATVAERAATHEYGSRDGKIPSRPFMRQAFDNNIRRIKDRQNAEFTAVLKGLYGPKRALASLGEFFVGVIKSTITRGEFRALKPATIARKGSSRPLIDTGEMRNSVTHKEYRTGII